MKTFIRSTLLSIAILFLFSGCGSIRAKTVIVHGRYAYILAGPRMEYEPIGQSGIYWKTRKWELLVDDDQQIFFNQQHVGQMHKGDELEVTWNGDVLLNRESLTSSD